MKVSVIIPVFNRTDFLEAALLSVIDQTIEDWEVIVVDDGSEPGCANEIESLTKIDERIRLVKQENSGVGLARRHGLEVSKGEFIQFLDSDDLLLPEKFALQLAALEKNPNCGIAYGITRLIDSDGTLLKEPYKWTAEVHQQLFPKLLVDRWWNTQTPLYRREICERAGPWINLAMSEDWEFEARIAGMGVELVHVAEVVCATRQHEAIRLTGQKENAGELAARVCLLESLWSNAEKVELTKDSGEMRHFSRWAFFTARRCGHFGLDSLAERSFQVAVNSALRIPNDFRIFKLLTKIVGWRGAARVAVMVEKLRGGKGKAGSETMELSWMSTS